MEKVDACRELEVFATKPDFSGVPAHVSVTCPLSQIYDLFIKRPSLHVKLIVEKGGIAGTCTGGFIVC